MKHADTLEKSFRLSAEQKKALERLRLHTVYDLLHYFPLRYSNISDYTLIDDSQIGTGATIIGKLSKLELKKSFVKKVAIATAVITDIGGTTLRVTWMNQPYIAKMYHDGDSVKLTGKITETKYGKTLMNPEISKTPDLPIDMQDSLFMSESKDVGYPVYPETRGISSKWIYHALKKICTEKIHTTIPDPIPETILQKYKLPKLSDALVWIHFPEKKSHAEMAQKRFAFSEIFMIQLQKQIERKQFDSLFSYKLDIHTDRIDDFISRFDFTPTQSQTDALSGIFADMQMDKPMSRLIEGDVGSGKTFVAAVASYATVINRPMGQDFGNLQVAYMAPTEVLATQLFENFIAYFAHTGISIGLITGSGCRKFPSKNAQTRSIREALYSDNPSERAKLWTEISRTQLLKWVKNGEIPILIGTHTLIQKSVEFADLGLVIIDEQHRFGTKQRMKLAKKTGHAPHYLSMTATPIPRTLAMTIYGDLDLTVIDQMPSGRKPVITEIVLGNDEKKRLSVYEHIREQIKSGRQAYVICPRIAASDPDDEIKVQLKSVEDELKKLSTSIYPEYRIAGIHSKLTPIKKAEIMKQFADGEIDLLVSTSVIEVGVNVPNATNIIIEGADRFGLAQLHQLRGRVIRSNHQAYCYLFSESKTATTGTRLQMFQKAKNGFELAELDLTLRGIGDISGIKQWGVSDIGMQALKNIKMVEYARNEARDIAQTDTELTNYPILRDLIANQDFEVHFE